jgi:hypothetical protein
MQSVEEGLLLGQQLQAKKLPLTATFLIIKTYFNQLSLI